MKSATIVIAFFLLGFGKADLFIPALLLCLAFSIISQNNHTHNKFPVILLLFLLGSLIPLVIGYYDVQIGSPIRSIIYIFVVAVLYGWLFQKCTTKQQKMLISAFIIGFTLDNLYVVAYSYLSLGDSAGYGFLISPYTGERINSPVISNALSIGAVLFFYYYIVSKKVICSSLFFLLVIVVFVSGIIVGGRAFFVVLLFGVMVIYAYNPKETAKKLLAFLPLVIPLMTYLMQLQIAEKYFEFILFRFEDGLNSNRFLHYADGLEKLILHPLGGFATDKSIESTFFFHNLFLDAGRLGGWVPVLSFALMSAYVIFNLYLRKGIDYDVQLAGIIFLVSLLIMQQDVIIEGNIRVLMAFYFASIMILISTRNPIPKDRSFF